jgi:hypothetical protein
MTQRAKNHQIGVGSGLLLASVACGSTQLVPASNAEVVSGTRDVALARSTDGVTLAAKADAWPGSPRVEQELTPIQIQIDNRSASPVRAMLADIRLVADGEALVAREPRSIEIEPQATTVGKTSADVDSMTGVYEFSPRDPFETALARQIQSLSLPVGPIASGERVQGFIYFDSLPERARTATLEVAVRRDPAGPVEAVLSIPFARD